MRDEGAAAGPAGWRAYVNIRPTGAQRDALSLKKMEIALRGGNNH